MTGLGAASNAPRAPLLPSQNQADRQRTELNGASKPYNGGLGAFDRKPDDDREHSGVGELLARIEQLEKVSSQQ